MQLNDRQIDVILKKQFSMVKAKVNIKTFIKRHDWYAKYEWTRKREAEFGEWLLKYLKKLFPGYADRLLKKNVDMWLLNYGWKWKEPIMKGYKSECCNHSVKTTGFEPDFYGDNPKTMRVGTCSFVCTKCGQSCNTYIPDKHKTNGICMVNKKGVKYAGKCKGF